MNCRKKLELQISKNLQCESKKFPLSGNFSNKVGNFSTKFTCLFVFLSTLDCEFLFNKVQF